MQVNILYEPVQPAQLYAPGISVLPVFVTEDQFHQAQFSIQFLQDLARAQIEKSTVTPIRLPSTFSVMLLAVHRKHNKKRILRKVEELYANHVTSNYEDFICDLPGLVAVDVLPFGGSHAPTYRFWNSKRGIVISTGSPEVDRLFRQFLKQPELSKFTGDSLQHPGVSFAFESALYELGMQKGFETSFTAINLYRNMVFISAEVYPIGDVV